MNQQSNSLHTLPSEPQTTLTPEETNLEQPEPFEKARFMQTLEQIVIFAENLSRERARSSK